MIAKKLLSVSLLTAGLGVLVLIPCKGFAKGPSDPCPCIAEEYKSEKAYPLYREAALDWKARKWEDAMVKYHQVIEKHPSSPLAAKSHMGIGLYLKFLKYYDEAIPEFQKGISMIPETRSARDAKTSIACIHTLQGKYEDALAILREVLSQAEDWDQVKYCSYWMKEICRLKAHGYAELKACGPRVLATILRLKSIKYSKKELSTLLPGDNIRTSMQDLKKAAEAKGLKATGVKLTLAQLRNVEMPVIALAKPDHYLVISSVGKNGFEAIDPVRGERSFTLSAATLQKIWTGKVLLFMDKKAGQARYALLTKDAMESSFGGVCDCCPEENLGDESENVEYDDPPAIWVNTVNLNMIAKDTDLSYSGLGPGVEIVRAYNADDSRQSAFGRSWTHSCNIYLTEEPSGDVLVNRGSGKIDRYYYIGSPSSDMTGTWSVTFTCTDTNCPDWNEVGEEDYTPMSVTQTGDNLEAHLYDPNCDMTGTVDGNSFVLSGQWIEADEDCILENALLIEGSVSEDSLSAATTSTLNPIPPNDPRRFLESPAGVYTMTSCGFDIGDAPWGPYDQFHFAYIEVPSGETTIIARVDSITNTNGWAKGGVMIRDTLAEGSRHAMVAVTPENGVAFLYRENTAGVTTVTNVDGITAPQWVKLQRDVSGNCTAFYSPNEVSWTQIGSVQHISMDTPVYVGLALTSCNGDEVCDATFSNVTIDGNVPSIWSNKDIGMDCNEVIGCGCQEIFSTTGFKKVSETGYITYEPGVYDTLIKNGDGTWSLKIKKDKTTQHFDPNGILTSIIDRNGNALSFGYDVNGNLTTITDAASRVTTFSYDANDHIIAITDPIGRSTSYAYDTNDNLISSTDMTGYSTTYTYDQYSYMTAITTPKGTTTINNVYDREYGYAVQSITNALGSTRSYYTYWTVGEDDVYVTDHWGNTTYYDNLDYGVTGAIIDPLGNTTSFGYDIFRNRNSITNANGNTTNLIYDDRGNVISITDSLGNVTGFIYDANDNLTVLTDALGRSYSYTYDANDNLTKATDPLSQETDFTYDSHGQLTALTDARDNTTGFAYDPNGNIINSTDPCGHTTSYTYDGVGRIVSRTDAKGNTVTYTYDGLDRVTEVNYPDGKITYTYDSANFTSTVDKAGQMATYQYDALNRMTSATDPNGNTIQYSYNAVGNLITITYPDNRQVQYTYDLANRLIRVTEAWNNTVYTYDATGNVISTKYLPYGITTAYQYDDASRLTSLETKKSDSSIICSYQYTLDAVGNRTAIEANEPLEPNITFSDVQYTYNKDNQLLTANDTAFQYDENGNLIQKIEDGNTTTYTYDYDNRLIQVVTPDNIYQYEYDPLGNRIAKTVNGVKTKYYLDINKLLPQVLTEADEYGQIISNYVYGLGLISKSYIEPWGEAVPYYYHYDGLGSTVAMSDMVGNLVNKYAYTPFGQLVGIEEAVSNPFRYVGKFGVMDDENGLLYMRARYYSPGIGRFINKDPIGFAGGINLYRYVENDPVSLIDPFGMSGKNYIGWWPGADATQDLPSGTNYKDWNSYKKSKWLGKGAIIHDLDMNYRARTTDKTSYFGDGAWSIHAKLLYNWTIGALFGPIGTNESMQDKSGKKQK